jgi:hypothetical protein
MAKKNEATEATPLAVAGIEHLASYLKDWPATLAVLAEPFDPEDIYFLPQTINYSETPKTATAAAYADSRVYTERMDAAIGPGFWQSEVVRVDIAPFSKHIKAKLDYNTKQEITPAQTISAYQVGCVVRVGIWMGPGLGWVWQDSTGAKDTADANWITSAEAQAYKRAMSKWGPGRYFYSFPKQVCPYDTKNGKWKVLPGIPDWAYPVKHCTECNATIETLTYTDKGVQKTMHFWDVYLNSRAKYGTALCLGCATKRRNATSSPEADQRLQQQAA